MGDCFGREQPSQKCVTAVAMPRFFFAFLNANNTFWPVCNNCLMALMQILHYGLNAFPAFWPVRKFRLPARRKIMP